MVAYFAFFLFSLKADPRFSLKYKKFPSFQYLFLISTLGTIIMLSVLVFLNLIFSRDLVIVFNLNCLSFSWHDILLGLLACLAIFLFILPIDALISLVRRKFLPSYRSRREDEVKKLILASLPKSQTQMFVLLTVTSFKAAIFEELIFRCYLLGNLLLWVPPVIAIIVSAFLFFVGHLYPGSFSFTLALFWWPCLWVRLPFDKFAGSCHYCPFSWRLDWLNYPNNNNEQEEKRLNIKLIVAAK